MACLGSPFFNCPQSGKKQIQQLARQFFKLSVANGVVSADQVGGVLAYVEKHRPANTTAVLKAYQRLIAAASIAVAMTKKYSRPVTATAKPNPALLAGLRIRVGDDLYESSVAGQLAALAAAV